MLFWDFFCFCFEKRGIIKRFEHFYSILETMCVYFHLCELTNCENESHCS